jgi:hypothetical protein
MTILRKAFTPEYNPSHMHGIIYTHKSYWKVLVAQRVSDLAYAVHITHILSDRRCLFMHVHLYIAAIHTLAREAIIYFYVWMFLSGVGIYFCERIKY